MKARESSVVGPWTRVRIALAVGFSLCLFASAAGLCTWLAERPGLRARLDLTQTHRNTLDPVLADLVAKLPQRATVDIFFQPMPKQIAEAGGDAQRRMAELLDVLRNAAPEKITVDFHDAENLAEAREALTRLRVDPDEFGLVVVHSDKNTAALRLFKDIAQIDVGNPDPNHYIPPRLAAFRGEEALAGALKRVSLDKRLKVYFTEGHGERNLYSAAASDGNEAADLGALATALVDDGFELERFEGKGLPVPDDCATLAIVDPGQAFAENEIGRINDYVDRGGRVLVTGSHRYPDSTGSTRELVARYGIDIGLGYVNEPVQGPNGEEDGRPECANIISGSFGLQTRHPVTESLARFGRKVSNPLSHPLTRKSPPSNVVLTELALSSDAAWVDLPAAGKYNWTFDKGREEGGKRFVVAFAAESTPKNVLGPLPEEQRGRLIVLGSPEALTSRLAGMNKDFWLNTFNWLASRDYRFSVAPRSDARTMLEVNQGNKLVTLRSLTLFLLPGLCAIFGLVTWYRRRREAR
ncbi:MAG TPA: Gldg family protein [Planctomycetota bacterium]|nr:Gldg family protein [Planctomycetota bacterium]